MHEYQEMVLEFHNKFGLTINDDPTIPNDKDGALRVNLNMEETRELLEAAIMSLDKPCITESVIGVADACSDMLYVIYGAGVTYGISLVHSIDKKANFLLGFGHTLREFPRDNLSNLIHFGMKANEKFAGAVIKKDLKEIEEALNNLLDFTFAVIDACAIKIDPVFREVQRSNMSKVWEDGTVRRRESDGKIMKPPTYSPADIESILEKQ